MKFPTSEHQQSIQRNPLGVLIFGFGLRRVPHDEHDNLPLGLIVF